MHRRVRVMFAASVLIVSAAPALLQAQGAKVCQKVSGTMMETIVPAEAVPNDPFGRILGMFTGNFAGVQNASITAFLATPPIFSPGAPAPSQIITVRHAFLTGPGDVITTLGKTIFNPGPATLPGQSVGVASACPATPCLVENPQVLDITGGIGRWVGATGQLRNTGIGNIDLPHGQGVFTFVVTGEVCLPAGSTSATSVGNEQASAPSAETFTLAALKGTK
jgi:hypothetical protein